jgi:long-chain acyl-CoA synthetase
MRVKRRGIYREVRWEEYRREVEGVCFGLRALGLNPGDRVAILGDPCPEWLYAEMGTMAAGGICYGIYPTSAPDQVALLLRHGGASFVVARDQEHVDKVLVALGDLGSIHRLLVIDPRGMFGYDDPKIMAFQALNTLPREPGVTLEALVERVKLDDPALIIFTSGTTGEPRGAIYTQRALMNSARDYVGSLMPPTARPWRTVCHLPLNHAFEQFNTALMPLIVPVVPHFGERSAKATETLFEVAPDLYASVPRYWQKLAAHVLVGLENGSFLNRQVYALAMRIGRRHLQARRRGRPPLWLRGLYFLVWHATFRPILDKVGLRRVKVGITGGGPIPRAVQTLWQVWGVNLKNLYGQTEAGFISVQREDFPVPGDVGVVAPSTTVRLAPDGEILLSSPGGFVGYWQDEAATRQVRQNGWVATGDVGELTREGRLRIVDRKRDLLITAGGKNVSPQAIEDRLRANPYVAEAVVFGEGRKYLVALVEIDEETVSQWARSKGISYGGFTDLAGAPEVAALIREELDRVNLELARSEQVKAFRILPRVLDPEMEGEPVTPTRKVKRRLMYERFRELVESMYGEDDAARIAEQVGSMS